MVSKNNEESLELKESLSNINVYIESETETLKERLPKSKEIVLDEELISKGCVPETLEERFQRRKSHAVVYITMFTMSIGFSIVLTGIWPYLKMLDRTASKELLGWVVAVNPFGQMLASPILGWLGTKMRSQRMTFVFTIVLFIFGNVLYSLLPLFTQDAKYMMMASRFIVGVSSANMALARLYISSSTKLNERTTALSITAAVQSVGYILGPIIQTVFAFAFPLDSQSSFTHGNSSLWQGSENNTNATTLSSIKFPSKVLFNMYSLTGWFGAALGCLNLVIFLPCIFKEFNIAAKEEEIKSSENDSEVKREFKIDYLAITLCLCSYFNILLMYVLLETLIVPLVMDMYAWEAEFAVKIVGIGLSIAGASSVFMFIVSGRLAKAFSDRIIYITLGLFPLTLSMLAFTPLTGVSPKIKYCSGTVGGEFSNSSNFNDSLYSIEPYADKCDGVGCPSTQQWCFYTPIIHKSQAIIASSLMVFGYPVGFGLCTAIFSKLMRVRDQGVWLGILTSTGGLSRFLGPIAVSYIYTEMGPRWTFLSLFFFQLTILIFNVIFYKRLSPIVSLESSNHLKQKM